MSHHSPVLLVGDSTDPHMQAVADHITPERRVIIDAATLRQGATRLTPTETGLLTTGGDEVALPKAGSRGWLRRLAPAGWNHGTKLGSQQAAAMAATMALLAAIIRDPKIEWVTPVDRLYAAENKLVQYRAAVAASIRIPKTLISATPDQLAAELGEPFVLKPLGPGNYDADGVQYVVYVRPLHASDIAKADLLAAPFLGQSLIRAHTHLRVVTVGNEAWVAELEARGLPLDWRSYAPAHSSFQPAQWPDVASQAVTLATGLGLGMTSQDWMVDDDGPVFTDLNPGGQWLFLPETVAEPVTQTLASWLSAHG